jgi:hypothetical protein
VNRTLPEGIFVQSYRGKIPGASHQKRLDYAARQLDVLAGAGIRGVFWHGFSVEMTPEIFSDWARLCTQRNLLACAAFGLDATDAAGKGMRMSRVAKLPECTAIALDAEGAYDRNQQASALAMGKAFRALAPNALVLDQSWPVPTVHMGFPYEQFAGFRDAHAAYVEFVDLHAEQRYCNDWLRQWGARRYQLCEQLFDKAEARLDEILPPEARRPHIRTIQGHGWADIPGDLDDCLSRHKTMLVWSEPFPSPDFVAALKRRSH